MEPHYLDLADFLLVAEAVTGTPVDQLVHEIRIDLAESALGAPQASFGGVEFYPAMATKAAILCSRIIRNHPLLDGNKRTGYLAMREFFARNGVHWERPGVDNTVETIEALAARVISEENFIAWVQTNTRD